MRDPFELLDEKLKHVYGITLKDINSPQTEDILTPELREAYVTHIGEKYNLTPINQQDGVPSGSVHLPDDWNTISSRR